MTRLLHIASNVSTAICAIALAAWLAVAAGWQPGTSNVSIPTSPAASDYSLSFSRQGTSIGYAAVCVQRYKPVRRGEQIRGTIVRARLQRSSDWYGIQHQVDSVFVEDGVQNAGQTRLVGTIEEWSATFWMIVCASWLLPGVRAVRRAVKEGASIHSPVWSTTPAAFMTFLVGMNGRGWRAEVLLALSLFLGAAGLILAIAAVFKTRRGGAFALNSTYWGMLTAIYFANHY